MGLLTNPSASAKNRKYAKFLIKYNRLICTTLYLLGVIWFVALSHKDLNNATYFSENALLPGLVYSEMRNDAVNYALNLQDELSGEREKYKNSMPYPWLLAKMKQIGLDTSTHNFTLNYPFGGGRVFTGKNVFGILRAQRIGSTESIVITTPYRPPDSVHTEISHSIPILLAFANFARKQKYWAKDIIFLITEQEQLGIQAWIDAYQGVEENEYLKSGTLDATAGIIQAAINLEIQSFNIDYVDVKIEGLNGQLPNLDLVNLVQRLTLKEGILSGHKQTSNKRRSGMVSPMSDNLKHMLSMILTQSTGVPNGNHGLFHRYGIQALTLEGYRKNGIYHRSSNDVMQLLKIVEGISRSLNNLLEKFHQSFFFYLLAASDRFISIGDYMPCIGLMAGCLLIKSFILWLDLNRADKDMEEKKKYPVNELDFMNVGKLLILSHGIGFIIVNIPFISVLDRFLHSFGLKTEVYFFGVFTGIYIFSLINPFFMKVTKDSVQLLHIAVLLELGTVLIIIGLLNFSLGFLLCIFIVPFGILLNPFKKVANRLSGVLCILLNPMVVIFVATVFYTKFSFDELSLFDLLKRSINAQIDAITFAIVDSIIYGNWLFDLISIILFPIWILSWSIICYRQPIVGDTELVLDQDKKEL